MSNGYVYVLVNPSMPGIVKIGMTTRNPEKRAAELSGVTGVPTPFILVYYTNFPNCEVAERQIHAILKEKGYRISNNREFFSLSSKEAIDCILSLRNNQLASKYALPKNVRKGNNGNLTLAESLIEEGNEYLFGSDKVIRDGAVALKCYRKAVRIGKIGYYQLAHMYLYGVGFQKPNKSKGIEIYKEGIRDNEWICGAGLWKASIGDEAKQGLELFFKYMDSIPDPAVAYYLGEIIEDITSDYMRYWPTSFYEDIIEKNRDAFIKQRKNILKYYDIYKSEYIPVMHIESSGGRPFIDPIALIASQYPKNITHIIPSDIDEWSNHIKLMKTKTARILEEICDTKKDIRDIFLEAGIK